MNLLEIVAAQAVRPHLVSFDKPDVIRELVDALAAAGKIALDEAPAVAQAVLQREQKGSTAIGRGVAIPHALHPAAEQSVCAVFVSHDGVDFDSLDGDNTHLFFLLISPPEQAEAHVQSLQLIAGHLRDEVFCRFLTQAQTAEAIMQVLAEADLGELVP